LNHNLLAGKTGRGVLLAGLMTIAALLAGLVAAPGADADVRSSVRLADGAVQTTYTVGPLEVTPGQNRIAYRAMTGSDKPPVDGWITRIQPNLTNGDGSIPLSSKVMFHHGVWLNMSREDATSGGPERFYATGEEKTNMDIPPGYGYRYKKADGWLLNHMIHNLTAEPMSLYITYTVDFIPDTAPQAATMKPVRPIWMDVDNGSVYPVFDVFRGDGGEDGEFTYPQDAKVNPYGNRRQKNKWKVDRDGVLLGTTGHVHTGGLDTELFLSREGAGYQGPQCAEPRSFAEPLAKYEKWLKNLTAKQRKIARSMKTRKFKRLKKKMPRKKFKRLKKSKLKRINKLKKNKQKKHREVAAIRQKEADANGAYQACLDTKPTVEGNRVRLFQSKAHYFNDNGPISWDVAMMSTKPDWRVEVKAGDVLDLQTTYETKIASWPESMGINIVYMADGESGDDPYVKKVDGKGVLNHGHYDENNDHGGTLPVVGPDPRELPNGLMSGGPFQIGNYTYEAGDFRLPGAAGRPPVIKQGQSFTFKLSAADQATETWHSLTSCKAPCNRSTGISYPIADGDFQFESGQLGKGGPPTVNRDTWSTPPEMPVGTHTYFCRIHPLMRGAFRVVK
jgi:hypothetical protein